MVFLGIVSGIVTPLGLWDDVQAVPDQLVEFGYVPDLTSYGRSTPARPNMPLSRNCDIELAFCPGAIVPGSVINQNFGDNFTGNISANPDLTATTRIPTNITTMFTSATGNSTVSGILDIQYRSWIPYISSYFDDHKPYAKGTFRHIDSLLSRDGLVLLEGVIADMGSGGIGFRNHTAPLGLKYGAQWDEDVLWVEPEISCANTNLSLHLTLSDSTLSLLKDAKLVDNGGFSDLRHGNPYDDWENVSYDSPNLKLQADQTAWLHNYLAGMLLNFTKDTHSAKYGFNVTKGREYSLPDEVYLWFTNTLELRTKSIYPSWLSPVETPIFNANGSLTIGNNTLSNPIDHPSILAGALMWDIGDWCSGQYNIVSTRLNHHVECGYFFGIPKRVDGGSSAQAIPGSKWNMPVHICAGAAKASVRTVSFSMNGTTLASLAAHNAIPKHYDDPSEYPLWAVENWRYPSSEGARYTAFWGIVDPAYTGTPGYNFTRAPALYLPNTNRILSGSDGPLDILAGPVAPYGSLVQVLSEVFTSSDARIPRYSGEDNLAVHDKWDILSRKEKGGSEAILRLVWTDMMASATVGTNSGFKVNSSSKSSLPGRSLRRVTVYKRKISYDVRYAIPAILFLTLLVLLLLMVCLLGIVNKGLVRNFKLMLNGTSLGRVAFRAINPDSKSFMQASTQEWLDAVGNVSLRLWDNDDRDNEEGGDKKEDHDNEDHENEGDQDNEEDQGKVEQSLSPKEDTRLHISRKPLPDSSKMTVSEAEVNEAEPGGTRLGEYRSLNQNEERDSSVHRSL